VEGEDDDEGDPEEAVELEGEGLPEEAEGRGRDRLVLGDTEPGHDEEDGEGEEEPPHRPLQVTPGHVSHR